MQPKQQDQHEELRALRARDEWATGIIERQSREITELRNALRICQNAMPLHITRILYEGSG
jgi:hypothetical protein